jgi:hypothetical protein
MADTILLLVLTAALISFILYIFIKGTKLSKKAFLLVITIFLIPILLLFFYTGPGKIESDILRVIHNSRPKSANEVYNVLFKKSMDECVAVINFQDQVIPTIDCCIWMELKLCQAELNRIIALKSYEKSRLSKSDSTKFINAFNDKPLWWTPQLLGDSVTKYNIRFSQHNEQTLIVADDSTHVYLCDQAL